MKEYGEVKEIDTNFNQAIKVVILTAVLACCGFFASMAITNKAEITSVKTEMNMLIDMVRETNNIVKDNNREIHYDRVEIVKVKK